MHLKDVRFSAHLFSNSILSLPFTSLTSATANSIKVTFCQATSSPPEVALVHPLDQKLLADTEYGVEKFTNVEKYGVEKCRSTNVAGLG